MSEAEATAAPGGRVVGRYVLYDEIAAGGMATVHIGRLVGAVGFSRSVAIKRLHAQFAHDPEFVNMFLEEARLTSRIRHANVVPVLDVESTQSELFLVMEFIQGETLSRLTRVDKKRSRVVPLPIALAIACDLLNGLHAAHEATDERGQPMQIVHRDVSPHNVMVGSDGISRVLDFGIAKAASSSQSTRDGEVKGKFAYMSPEQLSSVAVDRRADIFAAAIVLWEMLTGRRLFSANDPAGIVGKVLTGQIQPPSARIGGLPPALDALVMKALERDRGRRFATAADMARALENVGVPLARRSEVATWVKRIAGDTLKRRAKRLAAIETTGSFPGGAAAAMAVPLSGPVLPEATSTGSESGFRPIRGTEDPDASQTQAPIADDDERPRRSWPKLVGVAALAMAVGAGGFFVWQAGGWQGARAKVSRWVDGITNPAWKVTETKAAGAAASASAAATQASASPSATADEDDLIYELSSDGKPTKPQARPGGRPRIHRPPPTDPKLTTNVPTGPAGQSGDLAGAIQSAAGGGTGPGQGDAPKPKPASGSVPERPSQGDVRVAIGGAMGAVRGCFSPGNPTSRALVTFQSDGSVKGVSVSGWAAGRPEEGCVKTALSKLSVGPFSDATYSVPVSINP